MKCTGQKGLEGAVCATPTLKRRRFHAMNGLP
jgi:hypothetical protein